MDDPVQFKSICFSVTLAQIVAVDRGLYMSYLPACRFLGAS